MKYTVTLSNNQYHLFADDQDLGVCIAKKYDRDKSGLIYKLPENDIGRQWLAGSKIADGLELTPHIEKATNGEHTPSKKLLDYLTEAERKIYDDLMTKAMERKEADKKKPLTELEKAQRLAAKWQAKVEELKNQQ